MLTRDNKKTKINTGLLALLAGLIVARLSCVALTNIPLLTIGFIMVYALVFIVLLFFSMKYMVATEFYAFLALISYVFEVVISCLVADKGLFETQAFNAYILVVLFFVYLYVKRLPKEKQKIFFIITLIGFVFTFIYSIFKLIEDPMLSRLAATGRYDEGTADTLSAIGGFDTTYGGLLVFIVLTYLMTTVRDKRWRILVSLALISCVVFIVMATYATAIVLLVGAVVLIIFKKSNMSALLLMILMIVCFIFRESIGGNIMQWSKTINYSDVFQEKMYQIGHIIRYGESVGTLAGEEGRWARIGWSLEAFLQYPIFGAFTQPDMKIGSHSEVADMLGRFGIVGFTSIVIFFTFLFKDIAKGLSTNLGKKLLFVVIIVYLAIAVLDPALYTQQVLPIFLLVPFTELWVKGREE